MDMDVENSRTIAEDYIKYRLQQNGHVWESGRQGNVTPNRIEQAMRQLGDEFEERFRIRFDDMIHQLHLTQDNARDTFTAIVEETFADGVNWGRIVALFGFAGRFAVQCFQNDMQDMVENIVDWVASYMDNNLQTWMSENKSWSGFLEFHSGGPEARIEDPWPSFNTFCKYAAAGLGVLTLGAILTQKT